MNCMCGDKECEFEKCLRASANFIFTPRPGIRQKEVIHALVSGVRSINIDLSLSTEEELQKLVENIDWAIKIFLNEEKFNLRITKVCTIRGRQPRTGRMRNNDEWNLKKCDEIVLTSDKRYEKCSSDKVCYVSSLQTAIEQLKVGNYILIGFSIRVKVAKIALKSFITCHVVEEGCLKSYQSVKLPVAEDGSLEPTYEELEDCAFVVKNQFDVVIVPFVKRPEYYHTIKRMLKGNGIKLVAQVEAIETQEIDKIIDHFYGVYLNESTIRASGGSIVEKIKKAKKLLIADFFMEKSMIDAADSLLLKPSKSANSVTEAIDSYMKVFCELCQSRNSVGSEAGQETLSEPKIHLKHMLDLSKNPDSKIIISLASMRGSVEEIANGRPICLIVLLTKCPSTAKLCQLWRNVHAMVYVDCENKSWAKQREEMVQIAALYGNEMNMLEAKDFCVTWFNSITE